MKEIIPFTMALNTEETRWAPVPSGRKTPEPHYADDTIVAGGSITSSCCQRSTDL